MGNEDGLHVSVHPCNGTLNHDSRGVVNGIWQNGECVPARMADSPVPSLDPVAAGEDVSRRGGG